MPNGVLLVIVILSPSLLVYALIGTARLWRRMRRETSDRHQWVSRSSASRADLRRLYAERREILGQTRAPGRGSRTRALNGAYLDVLAAACRALDVLPPDPETSQAGEIAWSNPNCDSAGWMSDRPPSPDRSAAVSAAAIAGGQWQAGVHTVRMVRVLAVADEVDEALWHDVARCGGSSSSWPAATCPFEYLGHLAAASTSRWSSFPATTTPTWRATGWPAAACSCGPACRPSRRGRAAP